jgi:hypothetical protein
MSLSLLIKLFTGLMTLICAIFIVLVLHVSGGGTNCMIPNNKTSLARLDQAIADYKLDNQKYPDSLTELVSSNNKQWLGPYVKEKDLIDRWGNAFRYTYYTNENAYQLFTLGSDNRLNGQDHAKDVLSEQSITIFGITNE